ncbi:MAG: HAD family phosphatase [Muribaculum sp.]|nr:HAD family phosphatase [Muribaculaceae bacterium]MCM1081257.1 HAD family phosphatase [Muribaculum sp.]
MIKNLLFDLGGVICDIRRTDCEEAFRAMGWNDIGDFLGDAAQKGFFMDLEKGLITPGQFRDEIRIHISDHNAPDEAIDRAFCRFIVGIPEQRLRELVRLRESYNIYMLSNTNPIMWNSVLRDEFTKLPGKQREDYFDGIVTSFEEHCAKPEKEIFERVIEKFDIKAEETIFFDDSLLNCKASAGLGFGWRHVTADAEFYNLI